MDNILFDKLVKIRRELHQNPELGFKEFKTSALVQKNLYALDIPFKNVAGTGVIPTIRKKEGPAIVLRADMDPQPVTEDTDLAFHAVNVVPMPACVHHLHTTMQ